jgi:hypothetical protein
VCGAATLKEAWECAIARPRTILIIASYSRPHHIPPHIFFALVKLIRIYEWRSLLHPYLHSSLSFLAHALWDLPSSWSPHFLEATATRRKSNTKDRALCPANASGRRRDIEIGGGSAHA